MPARDHFERFYAQDRQEWRTWLEHHSAIIPGVWLIFYKKRSGQPCVSYEEAVEEALCFGWIDSTTNAIDEEHYIQIFSPRKSSSPWSKSNKDRIERLTEQGLMMPAGLAAVETARKNGNWTIYDDVETLTMPEVLRDALAENERARTHFAGFSNSAKKQLFWYVVSAKRAETKVHRVAQIVAAAEQGNNLLNETTRTQDRLKKQQEKNP